MDQATREGILLVGNANEPKALDPNVTSWVSEGNIMRALFEGLIADDPKVDTATPGGAATEVTSDDAATVWTAKLRPNGKWSDGAPVTAHDFAFAYERILRPDFGAKYCEMLYFLKGAEDFNKGKTKSFSTVGVEIIDDLTLRLTLRGPTPYFREILKHHTWYPVPRHIVLKHGVIDKIGNPWSRKENIVSNGPFKLKSWRRNHHVEVERNPHYWNAAQVTLNGVRFLPVPNYFTEARMFRDDLLHTTYTATSENVDLMEKENPTMLRKEPYLGVYFLRYNTQRTPLNDPRVRQALSFAMDRDTLSARAFRGYKPAYAVTPPMGDYQPPRIGIYDAEKAKRLLAEAGYPGGKGFPRLKILIPSSSETGIVSSQAIQSMWKNTLGVNVEIETKEATAFKVASEEMDYDISYAGWIGDYLDPLTFLELWTAGNGNNNTGWDNAEFTGLLQKSFQESDATRRLALFHQAETILMNEAPILPLVWQSRNYLLHPSVDGWHPLLLSNNPYQYMRLRPVR
ncbi:MAG: peptide ABC transporter substrate-binding protein [Akkermansiaceae bacterium]|nr:peptide ABC transporter substrate-binding protein [Akkermansiaceae bacterium]